MSAKKLTVDEHLKLASKARQLRDLLVDISMQCSRDLGKNHASTNALRRMHRSFDTARSAMDSEWHKLINDDQFARYGHIYYGSGKQE